MDSMDDAYICVYICQFSLKRFFKCIIYSYFSSVSYIHSYIDALDSTDLCPTMTIYRKQLGLVKESLKI